MNENREMLPAESELWNQDTIGSQLPVVWPETKFVLGKFEPHCNECGVLCELPDLVHGTVNRINNEVVVIRAVSYCPGCKAWTSNHVRVRSDERGTTQEQINPDTNEWEKRGFLFKHPVKSAFRWFWQYFFGRRDKKIKHTVCSS